MTHSDDEAEALVRFVDSKLCDHLVESCKWSNFRTEYCLWRYMPNPYNLGVRKDSTDADINKLFGLTDDEIKHVEQFVYGKARC